MLPPNLKEVRANLAAKPSYRRTTGEDGLLAELTALDKFLDKVGLPQSDPEIREELNESIKQAFATTSGPSGSCRCCGQSL